MRKISTRCQAPNFRSWLNRPRNPNGASRLFKSSLERAKQASTLPMALEDKVSQSQVSSLEPLSIEVHLPGDDDDKPSMKAEVSLKELVEKLPPPPDLEDPFVGVGMAFEFHPLELKREGRIQVSAVKAGKRYRMGSLQVISKPPVGKAAETKEAAN